jgi:hypothetical protein
MHSADSRALVRPVTINMSSFSEYTLCSAIHRAEGVRRAWNSDFKLLAQVAIASKSHQATSHQQAQDVGTSNAHQAPH